MGFFRGPTIIKEGLVQMVDAANIKSYISGSKIWTNLKNRSDSFCLVNSPSFSSSNFHGTLTFASASSQYASGSGTFIEENFTNNQSFTIGAFLKATENSVGGNSRSAVYANQRYKTEGNPGGFGVNIINNKFDNSKKINVLKSFISSILENQNPDVSAQEVIDIMAISLAIEKSLVSNKWEPVKYYKLYN